MRQTRGSQGGTGQSQGHHRGKGHVAHPDEALLENGVGQNQVLEFADIVANLGELLADIGNHTAGQVLGNAAGSHECVIHTKAGDALEDSQDLFAAPECDGHHGRRAQLVTTGTDSNDVRGNAVEFHEENTNQVRALGNLIRNAKKLFDRQAVPDFLEEGSNVVHAGAQCHALCPGAVFHGLFDTRVQISRIDASFTNGFAIQLEDQAKNTVGRGVNGTHVENDALVVDALNFGDDVIPVAALSEDLGNIFNVQART